VWLWTLYELNGYEPESRVLLRIITLRLHANRTFGFKMYLQKATVTTYKRGYIFGTTHTKHNLIMPNWLERSFEGSIINLFHFDKFFSWSDVLSSSINSSHFTENYGSLPRSQQPNLLLFWVRWTQCSVFIQKIPEIYFDIIAHLQLGLPNYLFLSGWSEQHFLWILFSHIPVTWTRPFWHPSKRLVCLVTHIKFLLC
jgi:hypothetical protein